MQALRRWLPVLAWAAGTLLLAGQLGSAARTGGWLLPWLEGWGLSPQAAGGLHTGLRKAGHALAYAGFAALAWRALQGQRHRALRVCALALLLALADEGLQARTPGREGSVLDVLLDLCGALGAVLLLRARARRSRGAPLSPPGA